MSDATREAPAGAGREKRIRRIGLFTLLAICLWLGIAIAISVIRGALADEARDPFSEYRAPALMEQAP